MYRVLYVTNVTEIVLIYKYGMLSEISEIVIFLLLRMEHISINF